MRLCFIANLSIHTRRLLTYLAGRGHELHLIGIQAPRLPVPAGVRVYDLSARTDARLVRWPVWAVAARRIVHSLRPDVLHTHLVAPCGWLGAATGYHPFVATAWGSDLLVGARRSGTQRLLARWVFRTADYVTCVSHDLARAAQALGADSQRLEVTPWGVDVAVYHPAGSAIHSGPIVLSPRSVKEVYRPLDIAQAIPLILEQVPAARFVIRTHNSDPELLSRFRAAVRDAGAAGAVDYVADLPDEEAIAGLYRSARVAVSVPSSDGTPSSVLEALACGAVPVVSDVPSLHEWAEHEREALFVPVGDVPAIAAAVVRLLADDPLRARMAAAGVRMVRDRADSRVLLRRTEEIYERVTA